MLLIPILIILAIVGFSFSGPIFKDLHFALPDLFPGTSSRSTSQKSRAPSKTPVQTVKPTATPARAPPLTPTPAKTGNSPYFKKIQISSFQATTSTRPASITLSPNFSNETQIDVTGWRIKSNWIGEFTIPFGILIIHPNSLGTPIDNIIVKKNDRVYLRGETNPFGRGANFRPNTCFGYLAQYYPNLPESFSCSQQKPSIAEIKNLTPLCQDFILNKISYSSCKLPNYSNVPGVGTNQECVAYITNSNSGFNYEGCYNKHSRDANFFSSKWYIYMDTAFGNSLHDSITLYDQNGLLVHEYIY